MNHNPMTLNEALNQLEENETGLIQALAILGAICHAVAYDKGFWDMCKVRVPEIERPDCTNRVEFRPHERNMAEALMLMVSELSEALEADRKGDIENFHEEIADTLIRIFDTITGYGYLSPVTIALIKKIKKNAERPHMHGKKY